MLRAPADTAAVSAAQIHDKAAPRLATLALPELRLMETLLKRQRTDPDPQFRWAALYDTFAEANKRRGVAAKTRKAAGGPRIVRTLPVMSALNMALRLANTNYGPAYTPTVENHAAPALNGAKRPAQNHAPAGTAGAVTMLTRANMGPDTTRYLMGQFQDAAGGSAAVVVRRVV